jgi:hypothetical protein
MRRGCVQVGQIIWGDPTLLRTGVARMADRTEAGTGTGCAAGLTLAVGGAYAR